MMNPESRLLRKASGKEARLCFTLHTVTENRHGLIVANRFTPSVGTTESREAVNLIRHLKRRGFKSAMIGSNKGYQQRHLCAGAAPFAHQTPCSAHNRTSRGRLERANLAASKLLDQPAPAQAHRAGFRLAQNRCRLPQDPLLRSRKEPVRVPLPHLGLQPARMAKLLSPQPA